MSETLSQAVRYWRYGVLYADAHGNYRWSRRAALPPKARAGRIATPYSRVLRSTFSSTRELSTAPIQNRLWR